MMNSRNDYKWSAMTSSSITLNITMHTLFFFVLKVLGNISLMGGKRCMFYSIQTLLLFYVFSDFCLLILCFPLTGTVDENPGSAE